jgi:holo-[acyl-carrier protein] synthase
VPCPGRVFVRGRSPDVILGTGIDLIEVSRFRHEAARRGGDLVEAVLSPFELECCRRSACPYRFSAARFAAKEALLKALGTGLEGRISWQDVEVLEAAGAVAMTLRGETRREADRLGVTTVHVALSHTRSHAAAAVVLEGEAAAALP